MGADVAGRQVAPGAVDDPHLGLAPCPHPDLGAGAEIRVRAGGQTQVRVVDSSGSYLSAGDIRAHFGLGTLEAVESVAVRWPDGSEQTVGAVPANKLLFVRQGAEPEVRELKGLRGSGRNGEAVSGEVPDGSRQR